MLDFSVSTAPLTGPSTVGDARRRDRLSWWSAYGLWIVGTLAIAAYAASTAPRPISVAFVLLLAVVVVCVTRPVVGVYLVVVFAVLGDAITTTWYPFTKNFSSRESVLYVNDQLSLNPLELCLAAVLLGWVLQMTATRQWTLRRGMLFAPLMVFTGFLMFGLFHGLTSGGDSNAALWELRAVLCLPLLYVLLTNLFDRRQQYERLYWLVMIAVFVNSLAALIHYQSLSAAERAATETFVSHGATLPMNAMLILFAASWMFRPSSLARRILLPVMLIPVAYIYVLSERRAAFVALIAALIVVGTVLLWTNRRAFWRIVPVVLVIGVLYTAAFWKDETSSAGFPAQAIKSVIAPDQVSDRNQSSDLYRIVEKQDILATIRASPVVGIGFGKPFLRPYPLPHITPFLLEPYMPHNAILWIWMKAGVGGFLAMLLLFGTAMRTGARSILRSPHGEHAVLTLTSVAFVLMYAVFAYVDIAWDAQNMVVLAIAMAQIGSAELLARDTEDRTTHDLQLPAAPLASASRT